MKKNILKILVLFTLYGTVQAWTHRFTNDTKYNIQGFAHYKNCLPEVFDIEKKSIKWNAAGTTKEYNHINCGLIQVGAIIDQGKGDNNPKATEWVLPKGSQGGYSRGTWKLTEEADGTFKWNYQH